MRSRDSYGHGFCEISRIGFRSKPQAWANAVKITAKFIVTVYPAIPAESQIILYPNKRLANVPVGVCVAIMSGDRATIWLHTLRRLHSGIEFITRWRARRGVYQLVSVRWRRFTVSLENYREPVSFSDLLNLTLDGITGRRLFSKLLRYTLRVNRSWDTTAIENS